MPSVIDDPTLTQLLGSIEANNLVLLCGAGVSIAPPSNLLPARQVAQICYDKYRSVGELPAAFRDDICRLAGHFYDSGQLQSVFLKGLARKIRGVFRFRYRHKSPRVVQVQY